MKRMRRVMFYAVLTLLAVVVLAGGAWLYVMHNVERPAYTVVASDNGGALELRDYPPLIMAEVTRSGARYDALRAGFGPLAGYIFAKERSGDKIAMTAPVIQQASEDRHWAISFIMPSKYALGDLPSPANTDVQFHNVPARRWAAIRFSGVTTDALIAEKEAVLRDWVTAQDLTPLGAPVYAYYNDPITPGFLRRNEVLFIVEDS